MENNSGGVRKEDQMDLPPGFRFHPTDEELVICYLLKKYADSSFSSAAIAEVDMNQVEPWELPGKAKMGEKEWYFFFMRDRKYPTGQRTNRATPAGYWKATGKDKEIYREQALVGMKKTLVFYKGRAPRGEKTNWICHEYRLEGINSAEHLPDSAKSDWVITRVFQKASGGERSEENETVPPAVPPLMDSSVSGSMNSGGVEAGLEYSFPGAMANAFAATQNILEDSMDCLGNPIMPSCLQGSFPADSFSREQFGPVQGMGFGFPGWVPPQDQPLHFGNYGQNLNHGFGYEQTMNQGFVTGNYEQNLNQGTGPSPMGFNPGMGNKFGFGDQPGPSGSSGPQDLDYIWD